MDQSLVFKLKIVKKNVKACLISNLARSWPSWGLKLMIFDSVYNLWLCPRIYELAYDCMLRCLFVIFATIIVRRTEMILTETNMSYCRRINYSLFVVSVILTLRTMCSTIAENDASVTIQIPLHFHPFGS
jgi:hypothetical protein